MSLEQYKDANRKELWDILQIQMQVLQAETAEVAVLKEQLSHLADIHTKNQLRIRQLEAMAGRKSHPNSRGL